MTTKSMAAEEYLCQKELEILQLREIVSGLYQAGKSRQDDIFYRYESLLSQKCDDYRQLTAALAQARGR